VERLLRDSVEVKVLTADSVVIARNFGGLWKQISGSKPVRIGGEGAYANPVVTPDGKWVVVSKTDSDWSNPNYIVRFNFETGREFRVNLEPADEFTPIVYLAGQDKILLRRAKDEDMKTPAGPDRPEYYLLAPASGETRLVTGEFAPLRQEGNRFLQATGKVDEFWAAIPDGENQTRVGRYNLKTFSFTPVLTVPHIRFDSMSMWVDEKHGKIYVVYEGQLISIPLPGLHAAVSGD